MTADDNDCTGDDNVVDDNDYYHKMIMKTILMRMKINTVTMTNED